jgi:hypothetical protein
LVSPSYTQDVIRAHLSIKVLDLRKLKYNNLYKSPKVLQVLLDFPILAKIIKEIMLSSYHLTSDNKRWSKGALDFLSYTIKGLFKSLINIRNCLRSYIVK